MIPAERAIRAASVAEELGTPHRLLRATIETEMCFAIEEALMARKPALADQAVVVDDQERKILIAALDVMPDEIYIKDLLSRFLYNNLASKKRLSNWLKQGEQGGGLIGKSDFDFLPYAMAAENRAAELKVMTAGTPLLNQMCQSDRGEWFLETKVPLRNAAGEIVGLAGVNRDVTQLVKAERALRISEVRFRAALDQAVDAIFLLRFDGRIEDVNQYACQWLHFTRGEILNKRLQDFLIEMPAEFFDGLEARVSTRHTVNEEVTFRRKDGGACVAEIRLGLLETEDCRLMLGIARDITERKTKEEKLLQGAFYDSLTGMPNRALLLERVTQTIHRAKRGGEVTFGLLFIDLDGFKAVNDRFGHAVGDELLIAQARRMAVVLRPADTVARLGGDEFVLLLDDVAAYGDAEVIANRVLAEIQTPVLLTCGTEVVCGASIGVALGGKNTVSSKQILHQADQAMYRAKAAGKGRVS